MSEHEDLAELRAYAADMRRRADRLRHQHTAALAEIVDQLVKLESAELAAREVERLLWQAEAAPLVADATSPVTPGK